MAQLIKTSQGSSGFSVPKVAWNSNVVKQNHPPSGMVQIPLAFWSKFEGHHWVCAARGSMRSARTSLSSWSCPTRTPRCAPWLTRCPPPCTPSRRSASTPKHCWCETWVAPVTPEHDCTRVEHCSLFARPLMYRDWLLLPPAVQKPRSWCQDMPFPSDIGKTPFLDDHISISGGKNQISVHFGMYSRLFEYYGDSIQRSLWGLFINPHKFFSWILRRHMLNWRKIRRKFLFFVGEVRTVDGRNRIDPVPYCYQVELHLHNSGCGFVGWIAEEFSRRFRNSKGAWKQWNSDVSWIGCLPDYSLSCHLHAVWARLSST